MVISVSIIEILSVEYLDGKNIVLINQYAVYIFHFTTM